MNVCPAQLSRDLMAPRAAVAPPAHSAPPALNAPTSKTVARRPGTPRRAISRNRAGSSGPQRAGQPISARLRPAARRVSRIDVEPDQRTIAPDCVQSKSPTPRRSTPARVRRDDLDQHQLSTTLSPTPASMRTSAATAPSDSAYWAVTLTQTLGTIDTPR